MPMERPPAAYDTDTDDDEEQLQLQAEEQDAGAGGAAPSVEQVFEGEPVPSPTEMFTARSVAVGVALGTTLSVVAMKMTLTSGYMPFLTMPAGLLGFFLSRAWNRLLDGCEVPQLPFTRQENTLIQTFVVACSNVAYTGGFGSNILAMSRSAAAAVTDGDGGGGGGAKNVDEPSVARLVALLFLTSFAGMFAVMPFRNSLVVRHHLTFPTGTATAHLINSMHTPHGARQASKQVSVMFKTFAGTVGWQLWQWFFSGGEGCGFQMFPIFGLAAAARGFYFDFSMTNVGIGLFSPSTITISMLAASVTSYGILWSSVEQMRGVIGITMVLADGAFHLLCILLRTLRAMRKRRRSQSQPFTCLGVDDDARPPPARRSFDDRRRAQVFLRDRVYDPAALLGYAALAAVSTAAVPCLYPQLRPGYVAAAYLAVPVFAFCNAYGVGVTDMSVSSTYGRIALFAVASWAGLANGGAVAGLAAGVVVMSAASTAGDLMQVFRTGYLTLTSPHAVLVSQVAGTALGCLVNPVIFWVLYGGYHHHGGDGDAAAAGDVPPYAKMYREMAMIAMSDQAGFPRPSVLLCKIAFAVALANSVLREVSARRGWRVGRYLPCTIAMGVGFFLPPRIAIGMFFGTVARCLWRRLDADGARDKSMAVSAGLICGDAVGTLLQSMLAILRARPPICIVFLSRSDNKSLDAFMAASPTSSSS